MNTFFWILWSLVALATLIAFYFFIVGLADGSVSSFNMALWLAIIFGLPILLGGTYWLKNHQYIKLAIYVLLLPATPVLGYLLFMLIVILSGPTRWN